MIDDVALSRKAAPRGRLKSMRVSRSVRDFVLDQLADLDRLRAQSMFGGIGLYADEIFFGILAADVLYFKVDGSSRQAYEAAGSKPFKPYADRAMTMPYYAVPVDVLESAPMLIKWARRAVRAARAAKRTKVKAQG
jgi:DNA transformation protein